MTRDFWAGPLRPHERAVLRRSLGLSEQALPSCSPAEARAAAGSARRAAAILRRFADVDVVAICGRNLRLQRRLDRLAARYGGRLTVIGFAGNMADWLRCADVVVTKAGPGTIAEAACCGAPLLLTSHLPGQEKGNTEFVAARRRPAGRVPRRAAARSPRSAGCARDRAAVDAMRAASARLGRPGDAGAIAELIAGLVPARPADTSRGQADDRARNRDGRRLTCAGLTVPRA